MASDREEDRDHSIQESDITYIDRIGKGTFGTVFKVTIQTSTGCIEAAAKEVAPTSQSEEELKFLSTLKHKNLITYYGCIREKHKLTIITELATKGDLQSFLQSSRDPLPAELVRKWTKEAADAIEYLHRQRAVHKDVKSSNFLITGDDLLKLCDFGTVGSLDATTKTEHRRGTVRWMAPEVIEKEIRSTKSDVYSYGVVTWQICTREVPFAKLKTTQDVMDAVMEGQRPKIPKGCPVVYRKIMQSCWREDHQERPSMGEVLQILESDQGLEDNNETKSPEEEDSHDEPPDRYAYFEKNVDSLQNVNRRVKEIGLNRDELLRKASELFGKSSDNQVQQATRDRESMERVFQLQKPEERMRFLKERQAKQETAKHKLKQDMVTIKATNAENRKFEQTLQSNFPVLKEAFKQQTDQMFQVCYQSEEWCDDDLQSFTRMSTVHAKIPHTIGDYSGEVKTYKEPQSTTDVLTLECIPSKNVLMQWKDQIGSQRNEGEYCYIETVKERYSVDTIDKCFVVHKALDIKKQVKEDLVWISVPTLAQSLVEKQPGPLKSFQRMLFHAVHDQIIDDYGMDPMMLAKICCNHSLESCHIQWFLDSLNEMQSDVFCMYPQYEEGTQLSICTMLEDGKEKPSSLIFVFNVTRCQDKVRLAHGDDESPHYILCYFNTLTNKLIYADSLGWAAPVELQETLFFYHQMIYDYPLGDVEVTFCHEPTSGDTIHICCQHCATFYPLQSCRSISGVVVIIIASVACLNANLFSFLTAANQYSEYLAVSHLQKPTAYSQHLRYVLANWLEEKSVDVKSVTPKNFDKYQLVHSFDRSSDVLELDSTPFQFLLDPVPGLVELLTQETPSTTPDDDRQTILRWNGGNVHDADEYTISSCSRMETKFLRLPDVSTSSKGSIASCPSEEIQDLTDPFHQSVIPDRPTLLQWQDQLMQTTHRLSVDDKAYIEVDRNRYDGNAINDALSINRLRGIRKEVEEELEWFTGYQMIPLADVKLPNKSSIKLFRQLIHDINYAYILPEYQMSPSELAQLCCKRQLSSKHIKWIVSQLNRMQSQVVCLFDDDGDDFTSSVTEEPDVDEGICPRSMLLVLQVLRENGIISVSEKDTPECHFVLCYVDIESQKIIYGDSYGWSVPGNLNEKIAAVYRRVIKSPMPYMEIHTCHDTSLNTHSGRHTCSALCATNYPLQFPDTDSAVVCCIVAAIACTAREYFKFLIVPQYNKVATGSLPFHVQHPDLHYEYLRRVLASWFADKGIDIDHVVPTNFEKYKRLAVPGRLFGYGNEFAS